MGMKWLIVATCLACCGYQLQGYPHRNVRAVPDAVVFELGTCRNCHKILVRDTIFRCAPRNSSSHISTIVSYDGVRCTMDEQIACVKITDRSDDGDGAIVALKSGSVMQPFIKLNITSHPGKGYHLSLEIRGIDPAKPDCT